MFNPALHFSEKVPDTLDYIHKFHFEDTPAQNDDFQNSNNSSLVKLLQPYRNDLLPEKYRCSTKKLIDFCFTHLEDLDVASFNVILRSGKQPGDNGGAEENISLEQMQNIIG